MNRFLVTLFLQCLIYVHAFAEIRYESFQGQQLTPYIQELSKICNIVYSEYPYLYNGNDSDYESYLNSYATEDTSFVCLAFDGNQVIGAATSLPLLKTRDHYLTPFLENHTDLTNIFYLGELVVLPERRHEGIGHSLVHAIIAHTKTLPQYTQIYISQIVESPRGCPPNYQSPDSFWKGLGFIPHPEWNFIAPWTEIGQTEKTPHTMIFWSNEL